MDFHDQKIYSIQIGIIPNTMQFHIGQNSRGKTITRILRNNQHFFDYGTIVYEVWAKKEPDGIEEIVKASENQPVYLSFSDDN